MGIFSIASDLIGPDSTSSWHYMDSILNDLHVTWEHEFGQQFPYVQPVHRIGLDAEGVHVNSGPSLIDLLGNLKIRTWYALPLRLPAFTTSGLMWKYMDSGAVAHNNP